MQTIQRKSGTQKGIRSIFHINVLCVTAGSLRMEISELEHLILNVCNRRHLLEDNPWDTVIL